MFRAISAGRILKKLHWNMNEKAIDWYFIQSTKYFENLYRKLLKMLKISNSNLEWGAGNVNAKLPTSFLSVRWFLKFYLSKKNGNFSNWRVKMTNLLTLLKPGWYTASPILTAAWPDSRTTTYAGCTLLPREPETRWEQECRWKHSPHLGCFRISSGARVSPR